MTNSRTRQVISECGIVLFAVSIAAALIHFDRDLPEYDHDVVGVMVMAAILALVCLIFCVRTKTKN
jgi:hypothetical protein